MQDALDSLRHFRKAEIVAARDLHQIHSTLGKMSNTQDFQKDSSFLRAFKHPQFKRAALASIPMTLTLNISAVQVARDDFWHKTMPISDPTGLKFWFLLLSTIFVWSLARNLDQVGRRRSAMGLILLMLLFMQVPVVKYTGDLASAGAFLGQMLLIILYQTVELVFSVYTAEVFPWQYNGVISNLPCGSNDPNSRGADSGMAISTSLGHGSIIVVALSLSTLAFHDFLLSVTCRSSVLPPSTVSLSSSVILTGVLFNIEYASFYPFHRQFF